MFAGKRDAKLSDPIDAAEHYRREYDQQARAELETYYEQREYAAEHASAFAAENAADSLRLAELHAQLAQADALTRIADALERMEASRD